MMEQRQAAGWQRVRDLRQNLEAGVEIGIAARLVGTGHRWTHNAGWVCPAASTIKLAILVAYSRDLDTGRLDPEDRRAATSEMRAGGSGVLASLQPGLALPLIDHAYLMVAISDNTASNMILDAVGLPRVQAVIADLGLTSTHLRRPFLGHTPAPGQPDNVTSAGDLVTLLTAIANDTAASATRCAQMRDLLALQQDRSRLARWLPVDRPFGGKSGSLPGLVHDAGLITSPAGIVAVAVLTRGIPDPYQAEALIGEIALAVIEEATGPAVPDSQAETTVAADSRRASGVR